MTIYRYKTDAKVALVQQVMRSEHVSGAGDQAKFKDVPTGEWKFSTTGPSPITMYVNEKPEFAAGASVSIVLEVRK